ncbi:MAG: sugar phosphate nucleotidyltransferase [bacterium]|nr:sugar phosphate nucleotidyltransferase [bacterium]
MKILIMAGGRGTRLWPLSRTEKPKQFQKLISDKTMLQETAERLLPLGSWSDIYISTSSYYVKEVQKELPNVLKENIIDEPVSRERASSIALSTAFFIKRCPDETVVIFPADHLIKKDKTLISAIKDGVAFLEKNSDYLLTIGVKPDAVDTGLGYIKKGGIFSKKGKRSVYKVEKFIEKPDLETAQKLIKSGEYFWNSGIYICKPKNLIEKYRKFVPDTYERILKFINAVDTLEYREVLEKEYPGSDPISFEYSIVENDNKVLMMPTDLGWSDIGSWAVLKDSLVKHNNKNFVKAAHLDIGSKDLLVYGSPKKLIATVGLKGLIIVDTPDVILICDKSQSQDVKKIVAMLEKTNGEKHL